MIRKGHFLAGCVMPAVIGLVASVASAETASPTPTPQEQSPVSTQPAAGEIVVTAQKRAQSINSVPLTITAVSGDKLFQSGITSTSDLAKVVPGLTAQQSPFNTPIYTLRGVGFFEFSLATPPTVAVYTDEVALPFSAMTKAAALDVDHVEVLKGPQGTLFGQNTTGGAINFIAAKPTDTFKAGADLSFSRFATADWQGFVSGPVANTLNARVSFRTVQGGDWQKSLTGNATLGAQRLTEGRLLLDWRPADRLKVAVNLNGWIDKSDSQAPQRVETFISVPGNPNEAPILALPPQPLTSRSADWTKDLGPLRHDDRFAQASVRADYTLTDSITITSISAYEHYKTNSFQDYDGSPLHIADFRTRGKINSASQELRLTGHEKGLNWILGANYEHDRTKDGSQEYPEDATTNWVAGIRGGRVLPENNARIRTASAFGNVEYEVVNRLTLQAGARYTSSRRANSSCARIDPNAPGFIQIFEFLQQYVTHPGEPVTPLSPGDCYPLWSTGPDVGRPLINDLKANLNEHNISWRGGVNYKTGNNGLLYVTVSKGYKAGSFPTVAPATTRELGPVTQESVLAYEIGFKQPLFNRAVQINGAAFYYDYRDKQLRGRILDPVFGPLDALVQVPKSRVIGAEGQVFVQPYRGLNMSVAATYLDTKIQKFTGYNQVGELSNFAGSAFPFAPKWTVVADGQYDFALSSRLGAFIGGNMLYNSATTASIGDIPQLSIKAYTLVDVRAGIKSPTDKWRLSIFGRNIFNTYYWTSANQSQDVFVRYTGKPATYGISLSVRY
jgi:iron complex outermembrane recepter protein